MKRIYVVTLNKDDIEREVGEFTRLSPALVKARIAARAAGSEWDWYVSAYSVNGDEWRLLNQRSSMGGLEVIAR